MRMTGVRARGVRVPRARRVLLGLAAAACATVALATLSKPSGAQSGAPVQAPTSDGAVSSPSASAAQVAQGRRLFVSSCSACHGFDAKGLPGKAPSLHGVGAMAADFYLQTGRMPLPSPRAQPLRAKPAFPQSEIDALVAYVGSLGGPAIPVVHPSKGAVSRGEDQFAIFCAGCHTIQAQGGIVPGAIVPSLQQSTPAQVAEAIRIGPYVMPRFSSKEISDADVNSIVRYVQSTHHPSDRGGWGIGRIGPIPEGMVAWLLAIASLLLLARAIGERA
jgi:ubiquinol-cytochrome c reductase cytochrome c subunit